MQSHISFSPSSYIVDRDPHKFGDNQEEYIRRSREVIAGAVERIRNTVANGGDLTQLFFEILEEFCKKRGEIARDAERNRKIPVLFLTPQDPDKLEQFGRRRDLQGNYEFQTTVLDQSYEAYGKKLLDMFRAKLFEMEKEKVQKKTWTEESSGVKSSLEIEILESQTLQERQWLKVLRAEDYPAYYPLQLQDRRNQGGVLSEREKSQLREACKRLKLEHPALYQRIKISQAFRTINEDFPSPKVIQEQGKAPQFIGREGNLKSFFLLATARVDIGGKMYSTSQYLTWLYRDNKTHPFNRMVGDSKVLVLHQDRFLIPDTLNEIAAIFKRAVLSKDIGSFSAELRRFQHLFAHDMCVERGAAALNEWYATAMAGARDCILEFDKNHMVDLLAISSPLYPEYEKKHPECVKIKKSASQP